ncbi:MAG: thrombospondin type 3 repeat-containing protein [Marmoricola sp.]
MADYDQDTLSNDWESQYQLNPMSAADALDNPDDDGLSNLDEYHYGTNPKMADTDGDGYSDGVEIDAGTDPLRADKHPIATPDLERWLRLDGLCG